MRIVMPSLAVATALVLGTGWGLAQGPPTYGPAITLEQALKAVAGEEAEAKKKQLAHGDRGRGLQRSHGALHRLDNTQFGSIEVVRQKAWTTVAYRRPSKAFQDVLAGSGPVCAFSGSKRPSPSRWAAAR